MTHSAILVLKVGHESSLLVFKCDIYLAEFTVHYLSFQIVFRISSYVKSFPRYKTLFAVMRKIADNQWFTL